MKIPLVDFAAQYIFRNAQCQVNFGLTAVKITMVLRKQEIDRQYQNLANS